MTKRDGQGHSAAYQHVHSPFQFSIHVQCSLVMPCAWHKALWQSALITSSEVLIDACMVLALIGGLQTQVGAEQHVHATLG